MTIPWDRLLDLACAVGHRLFDRERLHIDVARNQTFEEDGWKIFVTNSGHRPTCLIGIRVDHYPDHATASRLELPPLLGKSFPFVLPVGAQPFQIAISDYRAAQIGFGPGRYRIAVRTASGRTFRRRLLVE